MKCIHRFTLCSANSKGTRTEVVKILKIVGLNIFFSAYFPESRSLLVLMYDSFSIDEFRLF